MIWTLDCFTVNFFKKKLFLSQNQIVNKVEWWFADMVQQVVHFCPLRCVCFQIIPLFSSSLLTATLAIFTFHLTNTTEQMCWYVISGFAAKNKPKPNCPQFGETGAAYAVNLVSGLNVSPPIRKEQQPLWSQHQTGPPGIVPVIPIGCRATEDQPDQLFLFFLYFLHTVNILHIGGNLCHHPQDLRELQ